MTAQTRKGRLSLPLALWIFLFASRAATPAPVANEYPVRAVQAVFLYRFAGYVQWPASFDTLSGFTIAVLGDDEVAAQLNQLLPGHLVHGKPAKVESIGSVRQVGDAQMLYVGNHYSGNLRSVIEELHNRPVLVVTDQPGSLEAGSTVNFVLLDQHVRFEVSTAAASRVGLKIDSALLAVATHVQQGMLFSHGACRPAPSDRSCVILLALQ